MKTLLQSFVMTALMGASLAFAQSTPQTCTPGMVKTAYGCLEQLNCADNHGSLDGLCVPGQLIHEGCEAGYSYLPMKLMKQTRLQSGAYTTATGVCIPTLQ